MAIDTSNLETLIADFRALSQKDSVSPDSLGSLLLEISKYIKNGISQLQFSGQAKLINQIQDQVDELDSFINSLSATDSQLDSAIDEAKSSISLLSDKLESFKSANPKIYVFVENGRLRIFGHKYYIDNGYYPCVFRLSKKCNRRRVDGDERVKRCRVHKGWHVMGGATNVISIGGDNTLMFSTADHKNWHKEICNTDWSYEPIYLLGTDVQIPWGKSLVNNEADNEMHTLRMLRFRFAIGFTKKLALSRYRVEPVDCDSNIALFSVIFSPNGGQLVYNT